MGYFYHPILGEGERNWPRPHSKTHKNGALRPPLGQYVEQLLNFLFQPKKLVWRQIFADVSTFYSIWSSIFSQKPRFWKNRHKFWTTHPILTFDPSLWSILAGQLKFHQWASMGFINGCGRNILIFRGGKIGKIAKGVGPTECQYLPTPLCSILQNRREYA